MAAAGPLSGSGKAHEGNRTLDLFLTKEVLYRLSYVGKRTLFGLYPQTRPYLRMSPKPHGLENGAGNGIRTRDLKLGRLALYQLSYSRPQRQQKTLGGEGRIRTSEGIAGRFTVCSL